MAETNQYLIFGLPHSHLSQIVPFFKIIEHERSQHGKRALVSDCSISHTSTFPLPHTHTAHTFVVLCVC